MNHLKLYIKREVKKFLIETEFKNNEIIIYELISDWVISSLDDVEKRQKIGWKLLNLNIPQEYREVPSNVLFRVGKEENKFISYSYDYRGLNKMINWYEKIFNKKINNEEIIEKSVNDVEVLICIPTFFKKTNLSSGKRFDALWKSEYEVICVANNNISKKR